MMSPGVQPSSTSRATETSTLKLNFATLTTANVKLWPKPSQPKTFASSWTARTGKTTTVVELIRQLVQGSCVLAVAPSNVAVDNLPNLLYAPFQKRPLRLFALASSASPQLFLKIRLKLSHHVEMKRLSLLTLEMSSSKI